MCVQASLIEGYSSWIKITEDLQRLSTWRHQHGNPPHVALKSQEMVSLQALCGSRWKQSESPGTGGRSNSVMALETVTRGDSYNHSCIARTGGTICGGDSSAWSWETEMMSDMIVTNLLSRIKSSFMIYSLVCNIKWLKLFSSHLFLHYVEHLSLLFKVLCFATLHTTRGFNHFHVLVWSRQPGMSSR